MFKFVEKINKISNFIKYIIFARKKKNNLFAQKHRNKNNLNN